MNRAEIKIAIVMKLKELGFEDVRKGDTDEILDTVLGAMGGAGQIAIERERQITKKNMSPASDVQWRRGQLVMASECYSYYSVPSTPDPTGAPTTWPFHSTHWKPSSSPIRNLQKAGALLAAEIDRRERELK
jgi:hypothetical protein